MKEQVAYIDEFGDSSFSFEKSDVSSHFIVSAVIFDQDIESTLEQEIEVIRKKYFQTGEMKSSKVGDNDERRLIILNDLSKLNIKIYSAVVNKQNLYGQGFRYKQSFYKKLHSLVDRELYKLLPNLQVTADEYGTKEFMDGFIAYINKNHIPDLFNQPGFGFIKSHSSVLVQLADFPGLKNIPYIIKKELSNVGDAVFVLGYPLRASIGDEIKLTTGIISSKTGYQGDITSYQISAPVQPGNSGGPLFDDNGDPIGIVNAKHIGAENVTYAVKSNDLYNLIELLDTQPALPSENALSDINLATQVQVLKEFIYIIEVN